MKKPLPQEAVKQNPAMPHLSSMKVIYIVERLNDVFGLGGWYVNNEVVENSSRMIVIKSTFHAPEFGITIPDIFGGNDNADRGDAYKGACTDALSKIASYLYIGMDVYKGYAEKAEARALAKRTEKKATAKDLVKDDAQKKEQQEVIRLRKTIESFANTNDAVRLGLQAELRGFLLGDRSTAELRAKLKEAKELVAFSKQRAA
ncbi:MAG TPA: hypothetical protein VFJ29_03540 [Candidatus Kapabacteria bacterium]|nr:hypothetical protein [Candidatus Kapabacteria bacterium]